MGFDGGSHLGGIEWTWVLKDLLDRERGSLIALIFGYFVGFNLSA